MKTIRLLLLSPFAISISLCPSLTYGTPTILTGDHEIAADVPNSEDGNLSLDGTLSIGGNTLDFGTTGASDSAMIWQYGESGSTYTLTLTATRPSTQFLWQDNGVATVKPKMKLAADNALTIYDSSGTAKIVLDPNGGGNGLVFNGSPILTQNDADGLYISSSATVVALEGGSATGTNSFAGFHAVASEGQALALGFQSMASGSESTALASYTFATGDWSVAVGTESTASGDYSVAVGNASQAQGERSVALGYNSFATGHDSIASGSGAHALGVGSVAGGMNSEAGGDYSVTEGFSTTAQGFSQFVIGQYNFQQGNPSVWIRTDDLFIIGNGGYEYVDEVTEEIIPQGDSNAFVVRKNADTRIGGTLHVRNGVRTPPKGDLSMGDFTAGQNPADLNPTTGLRYSGE